MEALSPNNSRAFPIAATLYLLIPFAVFLVGWLNWYVAVPLLLAMAVSFALSLRAMPRLWFPRVLGRGDALRIAAAFAILCCVTVVSGVGGHIWQTGDHTYRNEIFRILVERPWPVVSDGSALVYYIGFWLPAALFGKLFGLGAGFQFQMVWLMLGMMLFFFLLCAWRKRIVLWPLIVFLLFSGLDALGESYVYYFLPELYEPDAIFMAGFSLDHWSFYMMFPSMLTNFFWSFQQVPPILLLTLLLLLSPDCKNYAFYAAPCLLFGTLGVVGIVPVALALAMTRPAGDEPLDRRWLHGRQAWAAMCRDAFSAQNLLGGGSMALLMWLYLSVNRSGGHIGIYWDALSDGLFPLFWLLSVVLEFGVYFLFFARTRQKNALLPVLFCSLAVCPVIQIGHSIDFCMRVALAVLPFVAYMTVDALAVFRREGKRLLFDLLVIVLAVGALTPISEILRSCYHHVLGARAPVIFVQETQIFTEPNFNGPAHGNLFFDVLAKTPPAAQE